MQSNPDAIVIATRNAGKVREFAALFGQRQLEVRSLADYADIPAIIEDGTTFAANALIKAKTLALLLGVPVLADDSGLCVDVLDGAPGVWSARYAGEYATDGDNNAKLVQELNKVSKTETDGRKTSWFDLATDGYSARFICALAVYYPQNRQVIEVEDSCEGLIIPEARGTEGFGYDPLFYLPEFGLTMAELSIEQKNQISHRAKAMRMMLQQMAK